MWKCTITNNQRPFFIQSDRDHHSPIKANGTSGDVGKNLDQRDRW